MTTAPDTRDAELPVGFGALLASAELAGGFGLDRARLVLAAGSRAEGLADAASDTDFLAIYDQAADLPRAISHRGAIAMPSALGPNWIGEIAGHEVNVEAVAIATLERLAEALVPPLDAARAPMLQPLEVRLLDRIRTGIPVAVGQAPVVDRRELAALRRRLQIDRLPAVVVVMNYLGALSYLRLAEVRRGDPLGLHVALDAVAEGVALSALGVLGTVLYGMKKVAPALRAAERGPLAPAVREADILEIVAGADPERRIACAWAALGRIEAAIRARAAGDAAWLEVQAAVAGRLDETARGPMDQARLFATHDPLTEAPAWFAEARAGLRRIFVDAAAPYPCYFAERGERDATNYYTYLVPGSDRGRICDAEIGALSRALRGFLRLPRVRPAHRLSLLCLVEPPASPVSFEGQRERFWDVLSQLIAADPDPWPAGTPVHPDDPGWNLCFAGEPLFSFGACPAYDPRRSRVLGTGLVLVFQPLTIFADIGGSTAAGQAAKRLIRDRLRAYEGVPLLADAGDGSGSTVAKWKQYFPPIDGTPATGRCPVAAGRRKPGGLP